jgi:hypothetical protein
MQPGLFMAGEGSIPPSQQPPLRGEDSENQGEKDHKRESVAQ